MVVHRQMPAVWSTVRFWARYLGPCPLSGARWHRTRTEQFRSGTLEQLEEQGPDRPYIRHGEVERLEKAETEFGAPHERDESPNVFCRRFSQYGQPTGALCGPTLLVSERDCSESLVNVWVRPGGRGTFDQQRPQARPQVEPADMKHDEAAGRYGFA